MLIRTAPTPGTFLSRLATLATAFLALAAPATVALAQSQPPNIIFIMADDHPWPVFGFMKTIQDSGTFPVPTQHPDFPPINTPNLDRLAARGAVFPVGASGQTKCKPSYRSALTGFYPQRQANDDEELFDVRIPDHLAQVGYISYGYGKIWTKYEAAGFTHGGVRDWDLPRKTLDPLWEFVDGRSKDGPPWFLWYGPRLPHSGFKDGKQFRPLLPLSMFSVSKRASRNVYSNVLLLDYWVGQLLDGLAQRGLDGNTLIVFMSDNGFLLPNSKSKPGENGFRTPILLSYPGTIAPNLVLPQMVHAIDILPTLLDYAGASPSDSLDGESMRQYVENPTLPGREFLFSYRREHNGSFLRTRDGIRYGIQDGREHIYDLTIDPDERNDLIQDPRFEDSLPVWRDALREFTGAVGP